MDKLSPEVIKIGGILLGLLLAGNIFFIKRLVNLLDETVKAVRRIEIEVAVLKSQVTVT